MSIFYRIFQLNSTTEQLSHKFSVANFASVDNRVAFVLSFSTRREKMKMGENGPGNTPESVLIEELPPEVFPYKSESPVYIARDGHRLRDATIDEKLADEEKRWWIGRYGDKVPKRWIDHEGWSIENYILRTPKAKLQENGVLLEAIVAYPLTVHPFSCLARKIPLSARLLALGFVNSLSEQPRLKANILERQKKMGVTEEVLNKALRLANYWGSQRQRLR